MSASRSESCWPGLASKGQLSSVQETEVQDLDRDPGNGPGAGEPEDATDAGMGYGRAVDHRVARAGTGQDEALSIVMRRPGAPGQAPAPWREKR